MTERSDEAALRYLFAVRKPQECLGCGKHVARSDWQSHSNRCLALERIVELAQREALDIVPMHARCEETEL